VTGYTFYLAPAISRRDEEGFSSCSAHPCHHAAATTPLEGFGDSVRLRRILPSSPQTQRLDLQGCNYEATPRSLSLQPGDSQPSSRWLRR